MSHAVIAQGGLTRLKEMSRLLAGVGIETRVLQPEDGCLSG